MVCFQLNSTHANKRDVRAEASRLLSTLQRWHSETAELEDESQKS